MSDPSTPNFKKGVGRLVTDRFDFQEHVDGYAYRHKAKAIDLSPAINIDGYGSQTNVQSALEKLALIVSPPTILVQDATLFQKGIIQLAGDLGGAATNIKVTRIQGFPVTTTVPTNSQVLAWNGSAWAPSTPVSTFTAATDLAGTNSAQTVIGLRGRPLAATAPTTNQVIAWNGSTWTPATMIPTGTGFATTTSGAFDASSTANIRYAGGKFQTDVNVQWKSGSITGDLQWSLGSSNRVLLLPDTSDTLVAVSYAQTLTAKTINISNNAITATGITNGDIIAANGGSFSRMPKGADGSFLGVQSGVVGYYTPASSTPSGTGFPTVTSGVYDASATANIRYSGGKLQTDVPVQYKNGSVTGDLSWLPSSSNKVLTLPDTTDTVVTRAFIETLFNKTISLSSNTLTASSIATGDLVKSNGSSFVRFGRGSALQVLRTNSGGTDLEWATLSAGGSSAGSANAVQLSDGSGGFLANGTLGLASGGSIKLNLTGSAVENALPVAGYATSSQPFRYQLAIINATGGGAYTPNATQLASPIWIVTNPSGDGYILLPNSPGAGTMWYIRNSTGTSLYVIQQSAYGIGTGISINNGQQVIIMNDGSGYSKFTPT